MDDRALRTLDRWKDQFTGWPRTIECFEMRLVGRDAEGDFFKGPGRIEIRSLTDMRFFMHGTTNDQAASFRKLICAKENPYNVYEQFRLLATDYRKTEWNCGFVEVEFDGDHNHGWPLGGRIESLVTMVSGSWVSQRSSVELLVVPPADLPMSTSMNTETSIGNQQILSIREPGEHRLNVLDTQITFSYEPSRKALWITGDISEKFRHPFAENWLTEPLRILLGVPIYPRLVARNFGDGTAHIWVRKSPQREAASVVGLLPPFSNPPVPTTEFWGLYEKILAFISAGNEFEPNKITLLYDELSHARLGTRWVLTLTLASTAEALANSLMTETDRKSEYSDASLMSMKQHLKEWGGDTDLRGRMISNLKMVSQRSVVSFLRRLAKTESVEGEHVQTWHRIRNSVMHGNLVEPWSSADGDRHLEEMLKLVHDLTRAVIDKGTQSSTGRS